MKKRIRSALAAFVCGGLFLVVSPHLFKECGVPWFNWDRVTGPHNFYFEKRIWLADARTIAAAIRFLYEFNQPAPVNPAEVVDIPRPLPLHLRPVNTNFNLTPIRTAS